MRLQPGEIFAATVETPPPGAAPGAVRLSTGTQEILAQLRLDLLAGEKVLAEVLPRPSDEQTLQIRILARSGEAGAKLEIPVPGAIRLAPGEEIPTALRLLLAPPNATLTGEILPFAHRSSAGVRFGGTELRFQLDPSAKPGDQVFVRAQDAGGSLTLQVLARGGPRAGSPPAEAAAGPLLRGTAFRPPVSGAAPRDLGLVPGNILTGVLVRLLPAGLPSQPGALFHGKPAAGSAPQTPLAARAGAPPEGVPPTPVSPGRTALIRFASFEMEVPWPQEALAAFSPGDPVRLWVRGTVPRLDLQLLPPFTGEEVGTRWVGTRWVPSGGAGERSFGPDLLGLAEGLAELQEDPGEEPALAREAGRLRGALERIVLRENQITPERVREAFESVRREFESGRRAPEEGEAPREALLRESLQRFLAAAREIGRSDSALANLGAGAGRALTSMEFLNAANALRQHADQGAFLQIPYVLGGERGTMDVVVRGDREGSGKGRERENYSAVLLLELEGLGPLRVDASLVRSRASVRFTTPSEAVGRFISRELPKLREAIESQQLQVERIAWTQGKVTPEPAVPVPPQAEGPGGGAPFIDLQV
ncbi:MAG: hypothetical protein A3J27_01700 [Candidatus Tectomicrobia bacterium RIFCSPLOWO2_12_FULL_69_37]|nr:MAG: hypothetical protein A3J27_01700 [Candidatus Tectomicrobia bacterium RIFCSPLOWO2_12_FULL_69_37]